MAAAISYGIVRKSIATIYECKAKTKESDGQTLSAISDQVLCGMLVSVTGKIENGYFPVKTFYGYTGYLQQDDVIVLDEETAKDWEDSSLFVIDGICVDVMSLPRVQGVCLLSLFRGAMVAVEEWDYENTGWAKVHLADGSCGYIRNQYLSEKKFSQKGVFSGVPEQRMDIREEQFRLAVTQTARKYLGVQYRWGGRCTAGIDCSGLTSQSYMMNGILIWRDAKIKEGFPVHEISREEMKPGDLMYFPGHIAMYLGNEEYIHSTGKVGSGGVVINSMNPESPLYRKDLADKWYAVGSVF